MAGHSEFVKLNVGGTKFLTTRRTLLSNELAGSSGFFMGLLGGQIPSETDSDGYIMIDRSPEKFRVILEYLRTGLIELSDGMPPASLLLEADYYDLSEVMEPKLKALRMQNIVSSASAIGRPRFGGYYSRPNGSYAIAFNERMRFAFTTELSDLATKTDLVLSVALDGIDADCIAEDEMPKEDSNGDPMKSTLDR